MTLGKGLNSSYKDTHLYIQNTGDLHLSSSVVTTIGDKLPSVVPDTQFVSDSGVDI